MKRYYVDDSSIFYGKELKYEKARIKKIVKDFGGKNIRYALKHGWSNQPQVVCFNATPDRKEKIRKVLNKMLKTSFSVIIHEKDW